MGSKIAGMRIVDMGQKGPLEKEGRTCEERWYQLKADIIGSYIIPGAVFVAHDGKGKGRN